jgi:hypothetical protein
VRYLLAIKGINPKNFKAKKIDAAVQQQLLMKSGKR